MVNKRLLILLALLLFAAPAYATVHTALSCSKTDVANKIAEAGVVNGDTVIIPPGTCSWASQLLVQKAITVKGSGIGQTILIDDLPTNQDGLIRIELVANQTTRLSGIEFRDGVDDQNYNGIVRIVGGVSNVDARRIRVDHCKFYYLDGTALATSDAVGVIDHNVFINNAYIPIFVFHQNWNGYTQADGSYAAVVNWGSSEFLFIEDNEITFVGVVYAATDAYKGARYVARHNILTNCWIEGHGTDSSQRLRGTRAMEIYENRFICTTGSFCEYMANARSGTVLAWNNTALNFVGAHFHLAAYRTFWEWGAFGRADGTNLWDINEPSGPFGASPFTATSGSGQTVTVIGAGWTLNQWAGYTIKKATGSHAGEQAIIFSNTSDTLTYDDFGGFDLVEFRAGITFVAGETFNLWKVNEAFDQPGRGGGTQILAFNLTTLTSVGTTATATTSGNHGYSTNDWIMVDTPNDPPGGPYVNRPYRGNYQVTVTGATTFTYTFAGNGSISATAGLCTSTKISPIPYNQTDQACYEWNNTQGATNIDFLSGMPYQIRVNEHYFKDTEAPGYVPYPYPHPLNLAEATPGTGGLTAPRNLIRVGPRQPVRKAVR